MHKRPRHTMPESAIQRAVFDHLRTRGSPGVVAWHCANGGYRRPIEAAILVGQGVIAGASDVMAVYDGKFYALELKAAGRRPTEQQLAFLDAVNAAGGYAIWCTGLDRALAILEAWQLLRPNRNARAA